MNRSDQDIFPAGHPLIELVPDPASHLNAGLEAGYVVFFFFFKLSLGPKALDFLSVKQGALFRNPLSPFKSSAFVAL